MNRPIGRPVSALVAVKLSDGAVYWIGGECDQMDVNISRDVDTEWSALYGPVHVAHAPVATVCTVLRNYTGHWREGAPDVRAALNPGQPLLPPAT